MEAAFLFFPFLFFFLPYFLLFAQLQPKNQLEENTNREISPEKTLISGEAKAGTYFLQTFRDSLGSTFLHVKLPKSRLLLSLLPFVE